MKATDSTPKPDIPSMIEMLNEIITSSMVPFGSYRLMKAIHIVEEQKMAFLAIVPNEGVKEGFARFNIAGTSIQLHPSDHKKAAEMDFIEACKFVMGLSWMPRQEITEMTFETMPIKLGAREYWSPNIGGWPNPIML